MDWQLERNCLTCADGGGRTIEDAKPHCWDCSSSAMYGQEALPNWKPMSFSNNEIAFMAASAAPFKVIPEGRKDDSGKLDITLLFDDMPHALEAVTEVLQWAVTKKQPKPYERGSWQNVEPFQQRYRAAQLRHMLNAAKKAVASENTYETTTDAETGLLELAHIATDALFQLEMAVREQKGIK